MAEVLKNILPQILPKEIQYIVIPHDGKSDLQRSIPIKLRAWKEPGVYFVILHDQDANDCVDLKQQLVQLCNDAGRGDSLIRIVCRELESWFLGDLQAIGVAYDKRNLHKLHEKAKYRDPDSVYKPSKEMDNLLGVYSKLQGARAISQHMDINNNRSTSFNCFISGIRNLLLGIQAQQAL